MRWFVFFFFKQKTAYEMRISDWSSDVCSSDLLLITAPFARVPLTNTEVLLPAYAGAVFVIELITSALLLALFSIQRSRAVLALSIGYLFSGLLVVPWALTFPGAFTSLGLPDAGQIGRAHV